MKRGPAARKVDGKAAAGENIPADDGVVWFAQGRQPSDFQLGVKRGHSQPDPVDRGDDWFASCFVDGPVIDWRQSKPLRDLGADTGAMRTGINKREGRDGCGAVNGRTNADLHAGAVLTQVVGRLAEIDLGPTGFFVICHRGAFAT